MKEMKYRYGIRTERSADLFIGLGVTWFTERALVISLLFWDIYIGEVYDMDA